VRAADCGKVGLHEIALSRPDVIVLDLGFPDIDGVEVVKRLRAWSTTPVLILSVRDASAQKVAALEAGADDYLTKPFDGPEMIARLHALLRRAQAANGNPVLTCGHLQIDFLGRTARAHGRDLQLTQTEYALLAFLARHAGRVVTHQQILREVWGPSAVERRHYLHVFLGSLRSKLEGAVYIRTEPGVGYRLLPDKG
jgi:two-component system, OmpR family, KDP operon response regulator KdpE